MPLKSLSFIAVFLLSQGFADAKAVKIHGFVTSIHSPTEFEIDDYRITREASIVLELEKSEDSEEQKTFSASDIRVGTEMEIRGEFDEAHSQLTAKSIKVHLDEHQHLKRTALLGHPPALKRVGNAWEGELRVDGQHIFINEGTSVTIKLNNTQKKAAKAAKKAEIQPGADKKTTVGEADGEEAPGSVLDRLEQIPANTFVSYSGIRQKNGTVLATKVEFIENELTTGEARMWKAARAKVKASNYTTGKAGELIVPTAGKFKLVPDERVQKYVQTLGMSLVPQIQRAMSLGDSQKIPFQFFVIVKEHKCFRSSKRHSRRTFGDSKHS